MKTDPVTEPDLKVHEKYGTDWTLCPYCNPARRRAREQSKTTITDADICRYAAQSQARNATRYLERGSDTPEHLWRGFIDFYNPKGGLS